MMKSILYGMYIGYFPNDLSFDFEIVGDTDKYYDIKDHWSKNKWFIPMHSTEKEGEFDLDMNIFDKFVREGFLNENISNLSLYNFAIRLDYPLPGPEFITIL